jgi:hypothetical protein
VYESFSNSDTVYAVLERDGNQSVPVHPIVASDITAHALGMFTVLVTLLGLYRVGVMPVPRGDLHRAVLGSDGL